KYHSGGLWTNACCSHPYPGELVAAAAVRRLDEEMALRCHLEPMFSTAYRAELGNGLIENEYVHVFGGLFDGSPEPNPSEVDAWRWQSLDEIIAETKSRPDEFTAWFAIYLERFGPCFREVAAAARSAA
ncbi:MAG: NUDIX domain-containing protein, partial [Hyphomicrobiaceae bacterium]